MGFISETRVVGGRWRLEAPIGEGGFGKVYRGQHVVTARRAAIKILHSAGDAAAGARFKKEVEVSATLEDAPGIALVYDAGVDSDGCPYVAMELLTGSTLAERMPELPIGERLALIVDMLDSLARAHDHAIVHRDLKPENVFVLAKPAKEGVRTKLLDFGIAKWLSDGSSARSQVIGTPHYMSPEHMRGDTPSPASDVWSVGVMLYVALTDRLPFDGAVPAIIHAVTHGEFVPLTGGDAAVPAELAALVDRCMRMKPSERPQDARALRNELMTVLERHFVQRAEIAKERAPQSMPRTPSIALPVLSPSSSAAPQLLPTQHDSSALSTAPLSQTEARPVPEASAEATSAGAAVAALLTSLLAFLLVWGAGSGLLNISPFGSPDSICVPASVSAIVAAIASAVIVALGRPRETLGASIALGLASVPWLITLIGVYTRVMDARDGAGIGAARLDILPALQVGGVSSGALAVALALGCAATIPRRRGWRRARRGALVALAAAFACSAFRVAFRHPIHWQDWATMDSLSTLTTTGFVALLIVAAWLGEIALRGAKASGTKTRPLLLGALALVVIAMLPPLGQAFVSTLDGEHLGDDDVVRP